VHTKYEGQEYGNTERMNRKFKGQAHRNTCCDTQTSMDTPSKPLSIYNTIHSNLVSTW
jgi:hypothetical protein